jgi:hypothetical protein
MRDCLGIDLDVWGEESGGTLVYADDIPVLGYRLDAPP